MYTSVHKNEADQGRDPGFSPKPFDIPAGKRRPISHHPSWPNSRILHIRAPPACRSGAGEPQVRRRPTGRTVNCTRADFGKALNHFPLTGTALNLDLIGISLATTITLVSTATSTDQQTAIAAAVQAVQNYVNNLAVGQELVINDIADQILNSSSLIVDVGQPNQPLGNIYVWRSRSDGSRYSRQLIADYTPALGERIVTEDIANAIAITAAS